MNTKSIKLDLFENSHSFFIEAIEKAIGAENDVRHWQFAILSLVQSLELTLKVMLKNIHPVLIYENIDAPKNTVSITKAIQRLVDPNIGNIVLTKHEIDGMNSAIKLRNNITHSDFELSIDHAQAQFLKVLLLFIKIQRVHFNRQIEDILPSEAHEKLIEIEQSREALVKNALQRIKEQEVPEEGVLYCPNCLSETFVIHDGFDSCYACTFSEKLQECENCNNYYFSHDMVPIHQHFEIDFTEGLAHLHNSYGYNFNYACADCAIEIERNIENQKMEEYTDSLEEEYYMRNI
ncbi:hypothetical protein [Marinomonas sp. CT5]|uniref:hypothetical protein n=1 Tax=Marinomonas sp. CT5 TaxID=2066133 RepID=UPI001BAFC10B|nr:hypothetical protein [Marinomonas sp. CT5]